MQQAISEEVNSRQAKAIEEIQEKYASGKGGVENSVDAPTGSAYMEKYEADKAARKARRAANENEDVDFNKREQQYTNEDDVPEDDDADYELRQIRQARLKEIKNSHRQKVEDIAKGHGQYREITQDDFIAEVTSSYRVVCHFYHRDFPKCEIMHYHIGKIVKTHMETKFIKINAEKSLFFVDKVGALLIICGFYCCCSNRYYFS